MPRVEIPHFSIPLRYANGKAVVNEQDTLDDIADCVQAILRTPVGSRDEHPQFGVPDQTFKQLPIDVDDLAHRVETWEPRVSVLMEEDPSRFEATVTTIRATLNVKE